MPAKMFPAYRGLMFCGQVFWETKPGLIRPWPFKGLVKAFERTKLPLVSLVSTPWSRSFSGNDLRHYGAHLSAKTQVPVKVLRYPKQPQGTIQAVVKDVA